MPGSNGPALALEIRDARPEVRTLFMSGYTEETMNQHGFDSQQRGFHPEAFFRQRAGPERCARSWTRSGEEHRPLLCMMDWWPNPCLVCD